MTVTAKQKLATLPRCLTIKAVLIQMEGAPGLKLCPTLQLK